MRNNVLWIFYCTTDVLEVNKLLLDIKTSNSSAIEGLSQRYLQHASSIIPERLTFLYNKSLIDIVVPKAWKIMLVVPNPNQGNLQNVSTYRTISLLPLSGKLLERIAHTKDIGRGTPQSK